jgi:hypothetical protein
MVQKLSALPAVVKRGLFDPVTVMARHRATTEPTDPRNSPLVSLWHTNKEIYFSQSLFSLVLRLRTVPSENSPHRLVKIATERKTITDVDTVEIADICGLKFIDCNTRVDFTLNLQEVLCWLSNKHEWRSCTKSSRNELNLHADM